MGLKAFASKSTVVVLLGRGPVSTSLVTTIIVRLPKKGGIWEEGQIRFVGKPVFLQLDWVEPIWLDWGEWIWCLTPEVSWDSLLSEAGNHQSHPLIIFTGRLFGSNSWRQSNLLGHLKNAPGNPETFSYSSGSRPPRDCRLQVVENKACNLIWNTVVGRGEVGLSEYACYLPWPPCCYLPSASSSGHCSPCWVPSHHCSDADVSAWQRNITNIVLVIEPWVVMTKHSRDWGEWHSLDCNAWVNNWPLVQRSAVKTQLHIRRASLGLVAVHYWTETIVAL